MRSRTVFWLVAALMLLALRQEKRWNTQGVFDWDAGGYFAYLPAVFIYHDPGRVDSLGRLVQQRLPPQDHDVTRLGIHPVGNGKYISKYPLGVALSQLPWFLGAHLYAHVENIPAAGHSWPYQEAATLAGTAYAILGLWVLRKLLRRYYSDPIVAWTLAGIGLGTNYFVYSTHEAALSHAVLFLWQASLLYCTARWYETPQQRWALGMGLFLGLATLTRFSEAIYVLIPMAWGLTSFAALRQRPLLWLRHAGQLALAGGLALAVVSLQFIFWRIASGHWVLEEYTGEHFDFVHPHIIDGLFSIRRGWLVYTPLVALMLVGILRLRNYVPAALPAVLLLLPVLLYITFSWGQWWYGWGFSTRPMVSLYPLLALPLGSVLGSIRFSSSSIRTAVHGFVVFCIMLNLWQGWQYVNNKLPGEGITLEIYKERFFEVPPLYPAESTPYTPPLPPPPPPTW